MPYYVGLDASKKTTAICVMNRAGTIVQEGAVESTPKAITGFLRGEGRRYARIGIEMWGLAPSLSQGLIKAGLPTICIETRQAHGLLKAYRNKTDRNDARGIAEMMRLGAYRTVHVKSTASQEAKALLTARNLLALKALDMSNQLHGLLLGFGIKLARLQRKTFERRVRQATADHPFAASVAEPLLVVRAAILREKAAIETRLELIAKSDPVCRRLMTAPGVGPLVALSYRVAIDDPRRFSKSRSVGPHLGLTTKTLQSGERVRKGRITCWGDGAARRALFIAANVICLPQVRRSWLGDWGRRMIATRGHMKAMIAVARRLSVILHRMWVSETDFQWDVAVQA